MGTMSASDAAPLPRLGEVFFDVRGSSRSMRLSWYADTGVSVFSIWQGGTCTGTFRLPMEELPRLIDALQRGGLAPDPRDPRGSGAYASQLPGAPTDPRLTALPGGYGGRETDFTGPVTGDFRALRPDDPAGTMVISPVSSQRPQAPRALPPAPLALPPGPTSSQVPQAPQSAQDYLEDYSEQYYPEQQRYPEQRSGGRRNSAEGYGGAIRSYGGQYAERAQYAEQGQYAERAQYAEQAQYAERAQYAEQAQYAERAQYAEQGQYAERAQYAEQGQYAKHAQYAEQGQYVGYAQPAYADPAYGDPGYGHPSRDTAIAGMPGRVVTPIRDTATRTGATRNRVTPSRGTTSSRGTRSSRGTANRAISTSGTGTRLMPTSGTPGAPVGSDRGYKAASPYPGQQYDNGSYQGYGAGSHSGRGYDSSSRGYDSRALRRPRVCRAGLPGRALSGPGSSV